MAFTNNSMPWWMRMYQPQGQQQYSSGPDQGGSLPPPADLGPDPGEGIVPPGPPSAGGPGSYPTLPPSTTDPYGGIAAPPNLPPGAPTTAGGGTPTTDPYGGIAAPPNLPAGGTTTTGSGNLHPGDDSGKVPGMDLSLNDRINMILHGIGLPPVPTGFDPFGGLPRGFTETNRFGGGAPTFGYTDPTLNTGPGWSGGSIFGQLPGVRGGPLPGATFNLGASGGDLGSSAQQQALFHGVWSGRNPMSRNIWQQGAGTHQAWGSMPGGTYPNYLNIWNFLRSSGRTFPGGIASNNVGAERTGQGIGGAGRPPTVAYQFGGVAGDDETYSRIGAATYGTGRAVEDKAHHIFSALGELGKYLHAQPTANPSFSPMPGEQPALQMPGLNRSASGLMKWLTSPSDVSPARKLAPSSGQFMPQLYDQRARGSMMARGTDTIPAMLSPGEVVLDDQQQSAVMPVPGRENLLLPNQRAKLAKRMWA